MSKPMVRWSDLSNVAWTRLVYHRCLYKAMDKH